MNPYAIPGLKDRKYLRYQKVSNITPAQCILSVAGFYEVSDEIFYKSYSKGDSNECFIRNVLMYVMVYKTRLNYREIGKYLGGFDHSTIIKAKDKIRELINTDNRTYSEVITILNKLSF